MYKKPATSTSHALCPDPYAASNSFLLRPRRVGGGLGGDWPFRVLSDRPAVPLATVATTSRLTFLRRPGSLARDCLMVAKFMT
ncbi:hypothetical protein E2C01_006630 [Portunus trituberculatus]|uniref:Uncharacterized protein n=1 Tax=Portunus trituberculatus TaxID=210409 RepID=A0A5B7CVW5_PORTR|nr:hypothetical protein [Portunus trituberculatus]